MPLVSFPGSSAGGTAAAASASIKAFKVHEKHEAGLRLLQSGSVCEAIQLFQEACFFDPENVRPIVAMAECYIFLCDLRSAIRCYRRAIWTLDKLSTAEYYRRAEAEDAPLDLTCGGGASHPLQSADTAVATSPPEPYQSSPSSGHVENRFSSVIVATPQRPSNARPAAALFAGSRDSMSAGGGSDDSDLSIADAESAEPAAASPLYEFEPQSSLPAMLNELDAPPLRVPAPAAPPPPQLPPAASSVVLPALTLADIRGRLAGVLDALGFSLYHVGDVEQALRCTTEALEMLHAGARASRSGDAARSLPGTSPYLAEPTIALHRGVYLMALQRDEEAEALLEDHFNLFREWRPQTAALLVQLYCNRQAYRKARVLLEQQESDGPVDASSAASSPPDEETARGAVAVVQRGSPGTALATSACPGGVRESAASASLAVAKYLFTESYARYRDAATASNDEASITRCLGIDGNDIDLLFRRAQLSLAAGKLKKSIKDLFRCVRETNGEHKEAIEAMTAVLFRIGSSLAGETDVQDAVTYYSESLKWRPDNVLVLLARGDCYTKMESFEEALADYEAVLFFVPDQPDATQRIAALHDLWGRKLFAMDRPEEAESEFTHAIKADRLNPEFYYHRALCRLKLNQGRYALRDVLSCKELNPTEPHLRAFIARYLEPVQPPEATHVGSTPPRSTKAGPPSTSVVRAALPPMSRSFTPSLSPAREGGARASRQRRNHSSGAGRDDDLSSSASLPGIKRRAVPSSIANAEGWVRGCQTTLHHRETGSPAQVK